jgi:hypothetical protein
VPICDRTRIVVKTKGKGMSVYRARGGTTRALGKVVQGDVHQDWMTEWREDTNEDDRSTFATVKEVGGWGEG